MRTCIGLLGTTLDQGFRPARWERWRPSVSIFQHDDLLIDRFELLHQERSTKLAKQVEADILAVSPETEVRRHLIGLESPWDFEQVYAQLYDFCRDYDFDTQTNDYLVHITTGTHVAQICMFLLAESRHLPARLLQSSPHSSRAPYPGTYDIIDLDLSRYDQLFARFTQEAREGVSLLKDGIETRNDAFNALMDHIERVARVSVDPMLLTGPTGAGKTHLARKIYDLKKGRGLIKGGFVEVNCATLRGDGAMSMLFGHTKGAFTGALKERSGLLRAADQGVLFLDEIGELGLDEQAMLLRAIEAKRFLPMGADQEVSSDFQLIAGTNRDLQQQVTEGAFREDLLARINLWTFELPGLAQRREDILPNLSFELDRFTQRAGRRVTMNKEARVEFLRFAQSASTPWHGNFRDLNASVTRMATLAQGQRIGVDEVRQEITRLHANWRGLKQPDSPRQLQTLQQVLSPEQIKGLDRFDLMQLADVVHVCATAASLSAAGRALFAVSRATKKSSNDADRLRKYLARFDLSFKQIKEATSSRPPL